MLESILPKLISLLITKDLSEYQISNITLNKMSDDTYVLTNHEYYSCKNNLEKKNHIISQFHAKLSNDIWEEKNLDCKCNSTFKKLIINDFENGWMNNLRIEKESSPSVFKHPNELNSGTFTRFPFCCHT